MGMKGFYLCTEGGIAGIHTLCLGLLLRFREMGLRVGYFKPLGYRYFTEGDTITDEDAFHMKKILELEEGLEDICPVVLTSQVVREAMGTCCEDYGARIKEAYHRVSVGKDLVVIHGALNTRQGWLLGISCYQLAEVLDVPVVLVERFDDAMLADNVLAARERFGHRFAGVIYNMIPPERSSFFRNHLKPRLEREGIRVLGDIPTERLLRSVTVRDLSVSLGGDLLTGEVAQDKLVEEVLVGAMTPEHALNVFRRKKNFCVVTGGDRSDIQLAAMEAGAGCIILSGNLYPSPIIVSKAREMGVPIILVGTDTFSTAERVELMIRTARSYERSKVERLKELVAAHVDVVGILGNLGLKG
jgi:BioD-like phosphotransacetylase family protein